VSFNHSCHRYISSTGTFIGHISYPPDWCRANSVEALANYALLQPEGADSEDVQNVWKILKEAQDNQGEDFYQSAEYFDDILWWSLAYTRAREVALLMKDQVRADAFLRSAMGINDVVSNDSWSSDVCGGGAYWSRSSTYKNAITNELYLSSSARLARLTGDSIFWDRAYRSMNWVLSSGMIGADYLIVDGLTSECTPTGAKYTYNQGVILGGISDLLLDVNYIDEYNLLQLGENITSSVAANMVTPGGVLSETSCGDGALFKGIYTRYLRYFLSESAPSNSAEMEQFLGIQADSLWSSDRDDSFSYFGKNWYQ
jgi:predicted alpha-1,6-mannanase (GH76 family)